MFKPVTIKNETEGKVSVGTRITGVLVLLKGESHVFTSIKEWRKYERFVADKGKRLSTMVAKDDDDATKDVKANPPEGLNEEQQELRALADSLELSEKECMEAFDTANPKDFNEAKQTLLDLAEKKKVEAAAAESAGQSDSTETPEGDTGDTPSAEDTETKADTAVEDKDQEKTTETPPEDPKNPALKTTKKGQKKKK